jgi:hypothetical protein
MNIEDVKIEDAADANYVIRKYFNNQLKNIKMDQLEQLVLTVYNMGKNKGASVDSKSSFVESPAKPANANPFKVNDRAKIVEEAEIGKSGDFVTVNTTGIITSVKGDMVSFLFESSENGEMIDASFLFKKLEKIS